MHLEWLVSTFERHCDNAIASRGKSELTDDAAKECRPQGTST